MILDSVLFFEASCRGYFFIDFLFSPNSSVEFFFYMSNNIGGATTHIDIKLGQSFIFLYSRIHFYNNQLLQASIPKGYPKYQFQWLSLHLRQLFLKRVINFVMSKLKILQRVIRSQRSEKLWPFREPHLK